MEEVNTWWDQSCDCFLELIEKQDEKGVELWIKQWKRKILVLMDQAWQKHLDHLEHIKMGIHYQVWGQRDPILAYEQETWKRFTKMSVQIQEQIGRMLIKEVTDRLYLESEIT
ncbi:hypothetical protein [Paenibacillus psychroresistens]|uniref:hypothetical protein n=1 Tax=Paenibacillus psychroresistens TaxID=1778678 RepID=UPI001391BB6B|nr:hypothetical protein [Paenibacillus psychroresistens]